MSRFISYTIANAVVLCNSNCDFACRDFEGKILCMDEEEEKSIRRERLIALIQDLRNQERDNDN